MGSSTKQHTEEPSFGTGFDLEIFVAQTQPQHYVSLYPMPTLSLTEGVGKGSILQSYIPTG